MAKQEMLDAGARLAEHLRTLGVQNPLVGAGSSNLFIYALHRDRVRINTITEWEGLPVRVSYGGRFRAHDALPALPRSEAC